MASLCTLQHGDNFTRTVNGMISVTSSYNVLMIDSCQHIMDTCLTVILLHDYCTQTYINLHKLLRLCVLSVVIIKTDDDDDDDDDDDIAKVHKIFENQTALCKPVD